MPSNRATEVSACDLGHWAASGLALLTGAPGGPPQIPAAAVAAHAEALVDRLAHSAGRRPVTDLRVGLSGRAALTGATRSGRTSVNGRCRLLSSGSGWLAVNLARDDDMAAVPAVTARPDSGDAWADLAVAAATDPAGMKERADFLGVPVGVLGDATATDAIRHDRLGRGLADRPARPIVVDLSALWAGPLCARLLCDLGWRVVRVHSAGRPDPSGALPGWWTWLRAGVDEVALDLRTAAGQRALRSLLESADVVIEASRPRALRALGAAPEQLDLRSGVVWLSITGYGRWVGDLGAVAFGDDAAVAGGLVAGSLNDPAFCGDALADPLTGLTAAAAVVEAVAAGGDALVSLAMAGIAARAAAPSIDSCHARGAHAVQRHGDEWLVECRHGPSRLGPPVAPPSRC